MTVKQLSYAVLVFTLSGFSALSCGSDESRLKSDSADMSVIRKIGEQTESGQKIRNEEFQSLKVLLDKYPESQTIRDQYKRALLLRGDWATLAELYTAIPESERSTDDNKNLAKAYFKLGDYKGALAVEEKLNLDADPEMRKIRTASLFHLGRYDEAKSVLDKNWQTILSEKNASELIIRGMIHFYQKDNAKAIEKLETALQLDPENITALNGLSRIYGAEGNVTKADEMTKRIDRAYEDITARETAQTILVGRFYKLEQLYKDKKYQECVNLAKELLPQAKPQNKIRLYQYLVSSYNALGLPAEAKAALLEAQNLQK